MQPFEPVTLNWKGKDYTVKPQFVWGLIGTIENVISRTRLAIRIQQQDIPETKIASAYVAALQYAGAGTIDPREVLQEFGGIAGTTNAAIALYEILNLANPPKDEKIAEGETGNAQSPTPENPQT